MRGPAQMATYLAVGFIVVGFVLIGLAWNSAAEFDAVQRQFPQFISGGLGGLALIVTGTGLLIVQAQRELTAQRARRMRRLQTSMDRLSVVLVGEPEGLVEEVVERELVTVGGSDDDPTEVIRTVPAPAPAGTREPLVVLGRSSYHDPECHLVANRDDLARVGRSEAVAADLGPCRICKP